MSHSSNKTSSTVMIALCTMCAAIIIFSTFKRESAKICDKNCVHRFKPLRMVEKNPSPFPKQMAYVLTHNPFCPNLKVRINPQEYQDVTSSKPHSWWHTPNDTTSPYYSYYEIVNVQETYRVCDEVELRIHALNGRNEPKVSGGDYFRVKAFTINDTFKAGTSSDGEVWDHGNGMYSAYVTLKWEGLLEFNVTLVHSSEAVWRIDSFPKERPMRYNRSGFYVSRKNESLREKVTCGWMKFTSEEELCTVSDPDRDGTSWYCGKPTNKDLSCSDWLFNYVESTVIEKEEVDILNNLEREALAAGSRLISGNTTHIAVLAQTNGNILDAISRLPPCSIDSTLSTTSVAGFYQNDRWFSPYCFTKEFSTKESMIQCLANKTINYIGDSTIRNLFSWQLDYLKLEPAVKIDSSKPWYHENHGLMISKNIHFNYVFHYFPLNQDKGMVNISEYQQEKHYIDSIDTKGDVVVVVSIWAHVMYLPIEYYRTRILAILDAADRLYQRNPNAVLLLKSPNTQTHFRTLRTSVLFSDWYARRHMWMLREMLGSRPRPYIGLIDVWGITLAQLAPDQCHAEYPHKENFNRVFLSTVCP